MKKFILVIMSFLFLAGLAYAHPPLGMDIKYDPETKQVIAAIAHEVSNPKRHFIEKVIVKVNGEMVELKRFHWQTNAREQDVVIDTPQLKPGDIIALEAYCNKGGRLIQQIRVQ